jgi:GNAT superfamily N-acetyltransferase
MRPVQSSPTLFTAGPFLAVELGAEDIPGLQTFFERNPEYFFAVNGQPPTPDAAHEEVHGALPQGWPFTKKWIIGFVDDAGSLIGMASVVSDLIAAGVWHVGLFIVASRLHGTGAAQSLYKQLEGWALLQRAQWMRLGVVKGNERAERFWASSGFIQVRERTSVEMGKLVNTLRVLAKPLAAATLPEYFALVSRDRPEPRQESRS